MTSNHKLARLAGLLYLILLSDELGIDPIAAAERKMVANAEKYPVEKARGTSKKYDEL